MKRGILIALVVIIVGAILTIILVNRHREKNVNTFEFPESVIATNYTENHRADTIAMLITHNILGYDTMNINIHKAPELKNDELEIVAFIQKTENPHEYNIFLKKTSKIYVIEFLSHEMIHLDQMEKGNLITFLGNYEYSIYMGDTVFYDKVPYEKRLFEIDAHKRDDDIKKEVKRLLYQKES